MTGRKLFCAAAMCLLLGAGTSRGEEKNQDFFAALFDKVRAAVKAGDYQAYQKLTVPSSTDPEAALRMKQNFAESKDSLVNAYPDLKTAQVLKFEVKEGKAIFVIRAYPDDPRHINLEAHACVEHNGEWKACGSIGGKSLRRKSAEEDEQVIQAQLKRNADFQIDANQALSDAAARAQ